MSFPVTPTATSTLRSRLRPSGVDSEPESTPALYGLTLAGKAIFIIFHSTRGERVGTTPRAVSPLTELELRGKNKRAARHETNDWCINLRPWVNL